MMYGKTNTILYSKKNKNKQLWVIDIKKRYQNNKKGVFEMSKITILQN